MILSKAKLETELARNCWNINDFVEKSGVSRSAIDSAFKEKNIRPSTAGKLAEALNTDIQNIVKN